MTEVTDDAEGARTLVLSTPTSAVIDFPDESDTFEIDLTANTEYTITLRTQG